MGTDTKANAKRAMQELFGGRVEELFNKETATVEEEVQPKKEAVRGSIVKSQSGEVTKKPAATVISEETVITGSVKVGKCLDVYGTILGNIDSTDDVHVYGRVAGDVNCKRFFHHAGAVKGDVSAKENADIESGAAVKGNVKGQMVCVDGRVFGNVSADESVKLLDNAIVVGDIAAKFFSMRDTATLRGSVNLVCDNSSIDDAFKDCFDF